MPIIRKLILAVCVLSLVTTTFAGFGRSGGGGGFRSSGGFSRSYSSPRSYSAPRYSSSPRSYSYTSPSRVVEHHYTTSSSGGSGSHSGFFSSFLGGAAGSAVGNALTSHGSQAPSTIVVQQPSGVAQGVAAQTVAQAPVVQDVSQVAPQEQEHPLVSFIFSMFLVGFAVYLFMLWYLRRN